MTEKILYIYGYGSSPETSSTMNALKGVITELGFELVSTWYDQKKPFESVEFLENYVKSNDIKYIVGHSLGGFYTLCIDADVKKIVINPCLKPHIELPKLDDFDPEIDIKAYEKCYEKHLRKDLFSAFDIMGLFGTHDELFCYYYDFKHLSPYAYFFPATHRPSKESFESIKTTIAEFLGGEPLKKALTEIFKDPEETTERNYDRNIKTFGIITAINPMGYHYSDEENEKRTEDLKTQINCSSNLPTMPIDVLRSDEKTQYFFVMNPDEDIMRFFATLFGQRTFVMGFIERNKNGKLINKLRYYETTTDETETRKYRVQNYRGKRDKHKNLVSYLEFKIEKIYQYELDSKTEGEISFAPKRGCDTGITISLESLNKVLNDAYDDLEKHFAGQDRAEIDILLKRTTLEPKKWCARGKWRWRGRIYYNKLLF